MLSAVDETPKKTTLPVTPAFYSGEGGKGIYGLSGGGAGLSFNRTVQEGGLTGKVSWIRI